jgi:hypothetical protein
MKWTEMVTALGVMAFVAFFITNCNAFLHQRDQIKLDCMKTGRSEPECGHW